MIKYDGSTFTATPAQKGTVTIEAALGEAVFFILDGKRVPVGPAITNTSQIDWEHLELLGNGGEYALYADDGLTREYSLDNLRILR